MNEFDLIEKYLAPLTKRCPGAFSLKNDAAVININRGYELVITKDAISEDIHFFSNTSPQIIAKKLIRTNLSDLAAMGTKPKYYLIAAVLPKNIDNEWHQEFVQALDEEQKEFDITLIGGDTVSHKGKINLSLTMLGEIKKGKALTRHGATPGDLIYVSGTIGDAALGLKILEGKLDRLSKAHKKHLISRYDTPQPRIKLGQALPYIATSCTDISDGLVADLGHICQTSMVSAEIAKEFIPLSAAAKSALKLNDNYWKTILIGGDDYELLFTISKKNENKVQRIANKSGVKITKIGTVQTLKNAASEKLKLQEQSRRVRIIEKGGEEVIFSNTGWQH